MDFQEKKKKRKKIPGLKNDQDSVPGALPTPAPKPAVMVGVAKWTLELLLFILFDKKMLNLDSNFFRYRHIENLSKLYVAKASLDFRQLFLSLQEYFAKQLLGQYF